MCIKELRFADDVDLISKTVHGLLQQLPVTTLKLWLTDQHVKDESIGF